MAGGKFRKRGAVAALAAVVLAVLAALVVAPEPVERAVASAPALVAAVRRHSWPWKPTRRYEDLPLAGSPGYSPFDQDRGPEHFEQFVSDYGPGVVCKLDRAYDIALEGYDHADKVGIVSSGDRVFFFRVREPLHDATFEVSGFHDLVVSIDPVTGCEPSPLHLVADESTIHGHVTNAIDVIPHAGGIDGCGSMLWLDHTGGYRGPVKPGDCTLHAFRLDGALTAISDPVDVHLAPGDDVEVNFSLPAEAVGGTGLEGTMQPDGIHVDGLYEGSPAVDAGLQLGDVVVAIDGQDVTAMTAVEFYAWEVGDAGTDVTLDVLSEDDSASEPFTVTLQRDLIDGRAKRIH